MMFLVFWDYRIIPHEKVLFIWTATVAFMIFVANRGISVCDDSRDLLTFSPGIISSVWSLDFIQHATLSSYRTLVSFC
jgi:hypothetical protein